MLQRVLGFVFSALQMQAPRPTNTIVCAFFQMQHMKPNSDANSPFSRFVTGIFVKCSFHSPATATDNPNNGKNLSILFLCASQIVPHRHPVGHRIASGASTEFCAAVLTCNETREQHVRKLHVHFETTVSVDSLIVKMNITAKPFIIPEKQLFARCS